MKRILNVKKKIGTLSKKSTNPFFKSQYLDLHSLLEAVEPLLQEEGLILMQPIANSCVTTSIVDSENGKLLAASAIEIPESITDPQKIGSAITYFRRYTLTSLLAISESDDDGNGASKEPTKRVFTKEIAISEKAKGTKIEMLAKAFDMTPEQIDKYNKL